MKVDDNQPSSARPAGPGGEAEPQLHAAVEQRFGVLPNFFRLAPEAPEITANLWGFARFAYLDNPLPSLFKERLFVHLSRFCEVPYCIARHVGFLVGFGRPSGDERCPVQTPEEAVRLLRLPFPRGDEIKPFLARCAAADPFLAAMPDSGSAMEQAIFACSAHVFLRTPQAPQCLAALKRLLRPADFEYLLVFLGFIRTAHEWTRMHPELTFEEDIRQLLRTHEQLAECLSSDLGASCEVSERILDELASLRQNESSRKLALQEAEAAVQEQDRRKDEFLATLAHELRNPLAPIRNALTILKQAHDEPEVPGRAREAREMVERQVVHMVRLIDDLLDVSRISRGKLELRRGIVELATVIHQAVETCRPMFERAGHEVTVTLPAEPVYLNADSFRLSQVFGNLLSNAGKFMQPGGRIRLTAERQGGDVVVSVMDMGIGIPPDKIESIFEMFSQVDKTLERSQNGLGIGLTLARRLVELHGGSIEAFSSGLGKGSELVVRLATVLEKRQPQPPDGPAEEPAAMNRRRILVVDDNQDSAESLAMLLTLKGNEAHTASSGREAIEAAARLRPDVILLDIGMPDMNGYAACRRIREQPGGDDVIIIALTGWGQDEDRRRSSEAGFNEHLVKPVDPAVLMKLLAATA